MKSMKTITSAGDMQQLSDGLPMPGIGYGTYLASDDTTGARSILEALEAGYRLIDTASVYGMKKRWTRRQGTLHPPGGNIHHQQSLEHGPGI